MPAAPFLALGERLTEALVTGNFDLYAQVMDLPMRIEPRDGPPYEMTTPEELERDFDLYHRNIKLHGITDIDRDIQKIDQPEERQITVTCRVNILRHANRVVDPFLSRFHMHQTVQGWRFFRVESSLGHINWTLGKGGIDKGSFT